MVKTEMDRNIPLDSLHFKEALKILFADNAKGYSDIREQFVNRFKEIEKRIGQCTDPIRLQQLDATQKFYEAIAQLLDLNYMSLRFLAAEFDKIDDTYWNTVINGEHLLQQNQFMKTTIRLLQEREDKTLEWLKSEKQKWYKDRIVNKAA